VDERYGQRYRELYQRHWWWRAREQFLLDELRRLRPAAGWPRILDVGCGDGLFFDALAEFGMVQGVESDATLVSRDNPHRGQIHIGPFDSSFQPGRSFDLILMLDVLEHLADPTAALRHAIGLLARGGTILITVPAFPALWTRHDDLNHHVTRYTAGSMAELAARAGMRVRDSRYFFHWLAPVKLAVRAAEALRRGGDALPEIPAAPVNAAAYLLSRLERKIVGRLPVPFGSSLLTIGTAAAEGSPS
jgi:SAM-dependent methyltransferase